MPYYTEKNWSKNTAQTDKEQKKILQSFIFTLVDMILYVCVFAKKAESVSIYEVNEG